jgi:drug/metabolite transporter (DMT)-like permease
VRTQPLLFLNASDWAAQGRVRMNRRAVRIAGYLALSLIWGSTWIGSEMLTGRLAPLRVGALRFVIGSLLAGLIAVFLRSPLPRPRLLGANLILGSTIAALPYALVIWGGQRTFPVLPILLFAGLPFLAALLGPWMGDAPAPRFAFQGALIGIGGVALAVSNGLSVSLSDAAGGGAILVAVLSQAASLLYAKRVLRESPLLSSTALQLGSAAAVLWLLSTILEHGQIPQWDSQTAVIVILLGIVGSGIGFLLYYWLLDVMEPYQAATLQWTLPLVAIGEGAIAVREIPPWSIRVGAAVVLASIYAVMSARSQDDQAVTLKVTGGPVEEG